MNSPLQENEEATLAELEARARELESELAGIQSAIAILHARLNHHQQPAAGQEVPLAPAWDTPIPVSTPPTSESEEEVAHSENIHLQSLQPYHPLRNKWELGSGLEEAQTVEAEDIYQTDQDNVASEMRLFGLLSDGTPWEQRIPFSQVAQEGGIIIGRDPGVANITLEEPSVSRAHVQLMLNEQGLVVQDMGSTNGSMVNNDQLSPYDNCHVLMDGDILTLGHITVQIEFL